MWIRKRPQNWNRVMCVGMFFLVIGALSLRFMSRLPGVSENLADGVTGLFYGLAIGCLLLSLRMRGQRRI